MDDFIGESISELINAITARLSRRTFVPKPLSAENIAALESYIGVINQKEKLKIRLVTNNGAAFNGLRKSYGMFSGVANYIMLIGERADVISAEKLGYYGEFLVLRATNLGLGTCWVGGTFDKKSCPAELRDGESVLCCIVIGETKETLTAKEKFIRFSTHRKSKSAEEMYIADSALPGWFSDGIKAVQKAPSAINRQPVTFTYKNGAVTASVININGNLTAMDLGIAKLHFEIGAGGGSWNFGNGAGFTKK